MTIQELINRLENLKNELGSDVTVSMEVLSSQAPVTDVEYTGSDENNLTVFIK